MPSFTPGDWRARPIEQRALEQALLPMMDPALRHEELGISRFDPNYYAPELGNHVLGGGFYATRLYHDRQVTGYVYNVSDNLAAGKPEPRTPSPTAAIPRTCPKRRC